MTLEALQTYLKGEIAAFPGKTALLCTHIDSGETLLDFGSNQRVVSASIIKVPILCAALDQVKRGKRALTDQLAVLPQNILPDTDVFDRGVTHYTLWELLYWMTVSSDNTATNAVIDLLGYHAINEYCGNTVGLGDTLCQRKMLDWSAIAAGRNNYTSAADQQLLYAKLCSGKLLGEELTAVAMDLLERQRYQNLIPRYIPDKIVFAHKTGGLDYLRHDAGVFTLPGGQVYLGIFTWEGPSPEGDNTQGKYIGRLGKAVFDWLKEAYQ